MLPIAWLVASALVAADPRLPETQIRASDGAVTIHAQSLPLSQILDRLASATGMAVTYEGPRPSTPITMSVDGISETEAILKLMEGLGVSYVFRTDLTGERVDVLIVSGAGAGSVVSSSAQQQQPSSTSEQYEEPVADYGHIPLDPAVVEANGPQGKPDLNNPYLGLPAQHFPQAVPQQQIDPTGSASQGTGSRNSPGPGPGPAAPSFPQGASYPNR